MSYPKDTRFTKWILYYEKQDKKLKPVIYRWVVIPGSQRKKERYPVKKYKNLLDQPQELKDLVIRLNHQIPKQVRTKEAVEIKHAFISTELRDEYKAYLYAQIPTESWAKAEFSFLENHFLNFFINTLGLNDPQEWYDVHQTKWAEYLRTHETLKSARSKKAVVVAANKFISWLHKKRPDEIKEYKFEPLSRARLRELEAKRNLNGEVDTGQYISEKDFKLILAEAAKPHRFIKPVPKAKTKTEYTIPSIEAHIKLGYYFGLRRSEILGLKLEDVRRDFLYVRRQLKTLTPNPKYGPLKGREERRIPYWYIDAKETYELIEQVQKQLFSPYTLNDYWGVIIKPLKFNYNPHDLRHSWITNSVRKHPIRDVQLAAGHKDIRTTTNYTHDDRDMGDEIYKPGA